MTPQEKRREEDNQRRIAYDAKRRAMDIRIIVQPPPVKEVVDEKTGKKIRQNIKKEMHISVMK
jgi:hypothetical protein